MSDSTSNLDLISSAQSAKEVTANALIDAASPATLFGRRQQTSALLTWGYYGGHILLDGVLTTIANGTLLLVASSTNYIEVTRAGVVSRNTVGFTAGQTPLYTAVTSGSAVTSYTDHRRTNPATFGRLVKSVAGSSNINLTAAESRVDSLEFTGLLTGNIIVVFPTEPKRWTIYNNTTGAFTLTAATPTLSPMTGIAVDQGDRVLLESDGLNIYALSSAGGGGGGGAITVQDEGSPLTTDAGTLNFVGAGVTATGGGATKTITIPGGGGSYISTFAGSVLLGDGAGDFAEDLLLLIETDSTPGAGVLRINADNSTAEKVDFTFQPPQSIGSNSGGFASVLGGMGSSAGDFAGGGAELIGGDGQGNGAGGTAYISGGFGNGTGDGGDILLVGGDVGGSGVPGSTVVNKAFYPSKDDGSTQKDSGLWAGLGVPDNANGNDGHYYFRSDGGVATHIYFKSSGTWAGLI